MTSARIPLSTFRVPKGKLALTLLLQGHKSLTAVFEATDIDHWITAFMGVAADRMSPQLPKQLEGELPTPDELAREFPLMALVKVRIDLERTLRQLA